MIPYLVLTAIVSFFSLLELTTIRNKDGLYFSLFLILLFFIGARDNIGTDWWIYKGFFFQVDEVSLVEPGYELIQIIVRAINKDSFYLMVFVTSFLSLSIKFSIFKKVSPLAFISILYYFGYYYIVQDANQVRQGLAAGILLYSIQSLVDKKFKKFIVVVLLATLFHVSSLVFLLCLPVVRFKHIKSRYFVFLVLFCTSFMFIDLMGFFISIITNVILKFVPIQIAATKLEYYIYSEYAERQGFYLGSLFLVFFVLLFSKYRYIVDSKIFNVVYVCFVLGVCLNFFFNSFAILARLTWHFILLGGILYSYVVYYEKRFYLRFAYVIVLIGITFLKINNFVNTQEIKEDYIPYKNIFFHNG